MTRPIDARPPLSLKDSGAPRISGNGSDTDGQLGPAVRRSDITTEHPAVATVLERTTEAFFSLDRDWRFIFVNAEAEKLLGGLRAQLLERRFEEAFPEAPASLFGQELRRAVRENTPVRFEARLPPLETKLGVRAYPSDHGISVYFRDVSAERRTYEALVKSERRLRLALDAGRMGTYEWNVASGVVTWSSALERMHGIPEGSFEGTFEAYQRDIHPDDRDRVLDSIRASLAAGQTHHLLYRIVRPDGETRWLEAHGQFLLDDQGAPTTLVGVCTDATERQRVEESLRQEADLIETLQRIGSSLTSELDLTRIVQTVTDEATKLTDAQCGAFFYDARGEDGAPRVKYSVAGIPREAFEDFPMPVNAAAFCSAIEGAAAMRSDDITRDARYSGAPFHTLCEPYAPVVSYMAVPVVSHAGEVLGGLFFAHERAGVFTDRHERLAIGIAGWAAVAMDNARLLASAEAARNEAEHANAAKSEFLAAMSHELRTPLNAIGGYAQLVEEGLYGPVSEPQRQSMARIRRAQKHLLALINDILNFARIEAGRLELQLEVVEIDRVIAELTPLVEPQLQAKGLQYRIEGGPAGTAAHADSERLTQVLLNLLDNAVKFTDAGSVVISWSAEGEMVRVDVRDTGRGISSDRLTTIFEPFVQVAHTRHDSRDGVGLGLAISRELARAMGGDLVARSVPEQGSVFTLTLLRSIGAADSAAAPPALSPVSR
jgi:PAS domain S-box-containing protein